MRETRTYCRICIAACGTIVTIDDDAPEGPRVTRVRGDRDDPMSGGYTCPRGRALPALHHHPKRLDHPMIRRRPGAEFEQVSWEVFLDDAAERIKMVIDRTGPHGVATYSGTGAGYDLNGSRAADRLLRGIGSPQRYTAMTVDAVSKLFVAELISGSAGLCPIWDEERCALLLLIGINPVVSHGHTFSIPNPRGRLRAQAQRGELWVLDPRRTETSALATRHLRGRPATDHAVLAYLIRELLRAGADERFLDAHADGVAELAAAVEPFDLAAAATLSGLAADDLEALLAAIRRAGRIAVLTGTGVSFGPNCNITEWLAWSLAAVTGSLDRPGGMWFNPGYLTRADQRPRPPAPPEGLSQPGPASRPQLLTRFGERPSAALVPEIEAGNIGALLNIGSSLLTCLPDSSRTRRALQQLDVLFVSDIVENETTALATHLAPTAGQLERADLPFVTDTFASAVASRYTRAVLQPSADRRPLWWILAQLGRRLGVDVFPRLDLDHGSGDDLLQPLIERSLDADALKSAETSAVASGPVFGWVTDKVLPSGRWRLAPPAMLAQMREPRVPDPDALVLTPRRSLRLMNGQLRDVTNEDVDATAAYIRMHPDDASARGLDDGAIVRISSRHGSTTGRLEITDKTLAGTVSVPHGWDGPDVCALTHGDDDIDPLTGMILQTAIPVTVSPADTAGSDAVAVPARSLSLP